MCKYRGDEQKKAYETETKHKICMYSALTKITADIISLRSC